MTDPTAGFKLNQLILGKSEIIATVINAKITTGTYILNKLL